LGCRIPEGVVNVIDYEVIKEVNRVAT
jgi:hypothetical protein